MFYWILILLIVSFGSLQAHASSTVKFRSCDWNLLTPEARTQKIKSGELEVTVKTYSGETFTFNQVSYQHIFEGDISEKTINGKSRPVIAGGLHYLPALEHFLQRRPDLQDLSQRTKNQPHGHLSKWVFIKKRGSTDVLFARLSETAFTSKALANTKGAETQQFGGYAWKTLFPPEMEPHQIIDSILEIVTTFESQKSGYGTSIAGHVTLNANQLMKKYDLNIEIKIDGSGVIRTAYPSWGQGKTRFNFIDSVENYCCLSSKHYQSESSRDEIADSTPSILFKLPNSQYRSANQMMMDGDFGQQFDFDNPSHYLEIQKKYAADISSVEFQEILTFLDHFELYLSPLDNQLTQLEGQFFSDPHARIKQSKKRSFLSNIIHSLTLLKYYDKIHSTEHSKKYVLKMIRNLTSPNHRLGATLILPFLANEIVLSFGDSNFTQKYLSEFLVSPGQNIFLDRGHADQLEELAELANLVDRPDIRNQLTLFIENAIMYHLDYLSTTALYTDSMFLILGQFIGKDKVWKNADKNVKEQIWNPKHTKTFRMVQPENQIIVFGRYAMEYNFRVRQIEEYFELVSQHAVNLPSQQPLKRLEKLKAKFKNLRDVSDTKLNHLFSLINNNNIPESAAIIFDPIQASLSRVDYSTKPLNNFLYVFDIDEINPYPISIKMEFKLRRAFWGYK